MDKQELSVAEIVAAIRDTAGEIVDWARSPVNKGLYANEADRTCIHIGAALAKLAGKLERGK